MASVYLAVRAGEQYQKQVAIKLIRRGMDSDSMRARFLQERQILANLDSSKRCSRLDGVSSANSICWSPRARVIWPMVFFHQCTGSAET